MQFITDPRYSHSKERQYETQRQIGVDISMTQREPYPQEVGLPRHKMGV